MLYAFAEAEESVVPIVRFRRVIGERWREEAKGETATGNSEYAVVVVRTMRKLRRGFERVMYVLICCLSVLGGGVEDDIAVGSTVGSEVVAVNEASSSLFNLRLRCGSTNVSDGCVYAVCCISRG